MKILADATLPDLTTWFPAPFDLSFYKTEAELHNLLPTQDILVCRSTLKVTAKLLKNTVLQCVATASSGTDHIDAPYLQQQNITLFDAKGCNAKSVADYVVACLAFLDNQSLIMGPKAAVIGMGNVGSEVASRLKRLAFDVLPFDPPKTHLDSTFQSATFHDLTACNLLCIHADLHDTPPYVSRHLLNQALYQQLKPGTIIINAARGGIVDEKALLNTQTPLIYCTDVYQGEPSIDADLLNKATLCTPHIAGHSIEAKANAVERLSIKLHHHYGLSAPIPPMTTKSERCSWPNNRWQDCVLALYNPALDTALLKAATDKKAAFLAQRQAHQYRHDFVCYDAHTLDQRIQCLLGQ